MFKQKKIIDRLFEVLFIMVMARSVEFDLNEIIDFLQSELGKNFYFSTCRKENGKGFLSLNKWASNNKKALRLIEKKFGQNFKEDLFQEEIRNYFDAID